MSPGLLLDYGGFCGAPTGSGLALDVKAVLTPPCRFHWQLSIQTIQGGVRMAIKFTPRWGAGGVYPHATCSFGVFQLDVEAATWTGLCAGDANPLL